MLSTIFHNSWQSGRVNLIFSPDIADGHELNAETIPTSIHVPIATATFGGA